MIGPRSCVILLAVASKKIYRRFVRSIPAARSRTRQGAPFRPATVAPVGVHSLTSTDSFRLRAQQSEQWRIALMLGALMVLAALVSLRRIAGDEVLSDDSLAVFTVGAFAMVIAYEAALFVLVRSANRVGRLLPSWWLWSNAAIELAFPLFALAKLEVSGPVGPVGALSAPMLLLIPIIIMLSVLRLRPAFTLWTGLGAGAVHAALTTHACSSRGSL